MKPLSGIKVDTTRLPTEEYGYFSVFPHLLIENRTYAVYRPANSGAEWGYVDVYREFVAGHPIIWEDAYGTDAGIQVSVLHIVLGFTLNYDLIIDRHGIVVSKSSLMEYLTDGGGELIDSVMTQRINRRIVDYTVPSEVKTLSVYAAEVAENGLE